MAAEYLLMAATLAEIKARMLLPRPVPETQEEEEDPRAALAQQLIRYMQIKKAAEHLAALPRVGAGTALSVHMPPVGIHPVVKPEAEAVKLATFLAKLWLRHDLRRAHEVENETLSLAERVESMKARLYREKHWQFLDSFCLPEEGRGGLVVSLMAMLELDRSQLLEWKQEQLFAPVAVRWRQQIH